jgi:hypothetical protein
MRRAYLMLPVAALVRRRERMNAERQTATYYAAEVGVECQSIAA